MAAPQEAADTIVSASSETNPVSISACSTAPAEQREVLRRVHTKEIFVGHLAWIDLHDLLVQHQQIPAHGRGEGTEPSLVLRMSPSGIVERCFWMKEEPNRGVGVSHPLQPPSEVC